MKAMANMSQDDDDSSDLYKKNKESWKLRQDSYLRAIGKSTDIEAGDDKNLFNAAKPKRQDSYLQAISSSETDGQQA